MTTKPEVVLGGKRVGRIRASWLLFKETWRFLRLDPEIPLIPLVSGLLNILLVGLLVALALLVHFMVVPLAETNATGEEVISPLVYVFCFTGYVITAFTLAFSQGAIAHTVITRLRGGNATLAESLKTAASHWPALFIWSLITATVGLVLQMLAERFKLLGRLVINLIGVAWAVLTYFVAPAIIIDNTDAVTAIKRSGTTLRQTFGETVMTNIGLSTAFFFIYFPVVLALVGTLFMFWIGAGEPLLWVVLWVFFLLFFVIALVQASLEAILKTLLYAYVMEHTNPPDFNSELLANVLVSKDGLPATPHTSAPLATSFTPTK